MAAGADLFERRAPRLRRAALLLLVLKIENLFRRQLALLRPRKGARPHNSAPDQRRDANPAERTVHNTPRRGLACNIPVAPRSTNFGIYPRLFRAAERTGVRPQSGSTVASEVSLTENFGSFMRGYRPYLELLRPANVVTALADVLAGYAVAGLGRPPRALLAARCHRLPLCRRRCPQRRLRSRHRQPRTARTADPERPRPGGGSVSARLRAAPCGRNGWLCRIARRGTRRPGNGRVHPALRQLGQAAGPPRTREHGYVPRAQPLTWCRGGAGGALDRLAARAPAPRLYRRSHRSQPRRGPWRTTGDRGIRSDILDSGAGGAARRLPSARGPWRGESSLWPWRGECCLHSGALTRIRPRGRSDTRSGLASCRWCCSTP